jgi:FixJ family two-component response regulator
MPQPLMPDEVACDATNKEMSLSNRRRKVLAQVVQDATDREKAHQLCLSVDTVAWLVEEIRARLDA